MIVLKPDAAKYHQPARTATPAPPRWWGGCAAAFDAFAPDSFLEIFRRVPIDEERDKRFGQIDKSDEVRSCASFGESFDGLALLRQQTCRDGQRCSRIECRQR